MKLLMMIFTILLYVLIFIGYIYIHFQDKSEQIFLDNNMKRSRYGGMAISVRRMRKELNNMENPVEVRNALKRSIKYRNILFFYLVFVFVLLMVWSKVLRNHF